MRIEKGCFFSFWIFAILHIQIKFIPLPKTWKNQQKCRREPPLTSVKLKKKPKKLAKTHVSQCVLLCLFSGPKSAKKLSYACTECEVNFSTKYAMTFHERHNCGVLRRCAHCGSTYKRIQDIRVHFRKQHPNLALNFQAFRKDGTTL